VATLIRRLKLSYTTATYYFSNDAY